MRRADDERDGPAPQHPGHEQTALALGIARTPGDLRAGAVEAAALEHRRTGVLELAPVRLHRPGDALALARELSIGRCVADRLAALVALERLAAPGLVG